MEKTIYYNLKMICGSGGGQTRTLRQVYHFISAQQRHLKQEPSSKLFFVNILDGNECYKKMKLFPKVEHGQICWFLKNTLLGLQFEVLLDMISRRFKNDL